MNNDLEKCFTSLHDVYTHTHARTHTTRKPAIALKAANKSLENGCFSVRNLELMGLNNVKPLVSSFNIFQ